MKFFRSDPVLHTSPIWFNVKFFLSINSKRAHHIAGY